MTIRGRKTHEKSRLNSIKMLDAAGDEMALSEHIEEFSQRIVFCIINLILATFLCFANVRDIVKVFQAPAIGVKFLQFAPGEYFFASFKIALFSGILISSPIILYQLLLYLIPGLTKNERNIILPVSLGSGILFFCGLIFSYFFWYLQLSIFLFPMGQKSLSLFGLLINISISLQY